MISELINFLILVGAGIAALVGIGVAIQLLQQRDARKQGDGPPDHKHHEAGRTK
jgi:hypothetical protein